jgi:hypothetical protein
MYLMSRISIQYIILTLLLFHTATLYAQEGGEKTPAGGERNIDSVMAISPLYMPVSFTQIEPHFFTSLSYQPIDTAIDRIHIYNPFFKIENIYQEIGMPGQAHQNMAFDFISDGAFSWMRLPYPLYFKQQNELDFYKVKTSFTRIAYAYSPVKRNTFHAVHAQKFKGVNAVVHLNGFLGNGDYVNQNCGFFSMDGAVQYTIPSKIYGFRVAYIFNRTTANENGGLYHSDSSKTYGYADFISGGFDPVSNTPISPTDYKVINSYAQSKVLTHDILLQQFVDLRFKGKERNFSLGNITHTFQLKNLKSDYLSPVYLDSLGYSTLYPTDTLIDSLHSYSIINTLQWNNYNIFEESPFKKHFFHLAAGIMHEFNHLAAWRFSNHSFSLFGRTAVRLFSILDIEGDLAYSFSGYLHNNATAQAAATFAINRKTGHYIGAGIHYYRLTPDYIFTKYRGNTLEWDTSFKKQNIVKLEVFWTIKKMKLAFNYFLLDNYVKFNPLLMPSACPDLINVVQLNLYTPFRIKGFGLHSNLYLQYSGHEYLSLPLFAGKATLYYIFDFFKKKLKLQIGTDFMFNTAYYADGYAPILHQFHYQTEVKTGNYLYLGTYINLKIQRIGAFFRYDNLLVGALPNRYSTTPYYPMTGRKFSVGINWRFYD